MKNKSKTDWKLAEDTTEKFNRYGIRKYNVGAASVAILSGLFFLGGVDAQASENTSSQASTQAVATESGSSTTANTWKKAITTVLEKEKNTNLTNANVENKSAETVASKAVENRTESATPRSARRARSVEENSNEANVGTQPAAIDSTGSQPAVQPKPTTPAFYYDNNNNGVYDEGIDEAIETNSPQPETD